MKTRAPGNGTSTQHVGIGVVAVVVAVVDVVAAVAAAVVVAVSVLSLLECVWHILNDLGVQANKIT